MIITVLRSFSEYVCNSPLRWTYLCMWVCIHMHVKIQYVIDIYTYSHIKLYTFIYICKVYVCWRSFSFYSHSYFLKSVSAKVAGFIISSKSPFRSIWFWNFHNVAKIFLTLLENCNCMKRSKCWIKCDVQIYAWELNVGTSKTR